VLAINTFQARGRLCIKVYVLTDVRCRVWTLCAKLEQGSGDLSLSVLLSKEMCKFGRCLNQFYMSML